MSVALESVPMLNLLLDSSKFVPVREKLLVVIARPVELPLMLLVGLPKRKLGVRILTELPLSVVLPELCMDKLPPLPLMKFVVLPKKKFDDDTDNSVPSNFINPPSFFPAKNLAEPSLAVICIKIPDLSPLMPSKPSNTLPLVIANVIPLVCGNRVFI